MPNHEPQSAPAGSSAASLPQLAPACEPQLRIQVRDMLWPIIVCKKGCRDFGLEQKNLVRTSDRPEVGGWLRRAKPKVLVAGGGNRPSFGEAQYYVLDDAKGLCLLKNDEVKETLKFTKIVSVTAHADETSKPKLYYFRVVGISKGEPKIWELSPTDTSDRQLVLAWTCALQIRSKTYDVVLDLDYEKALKVALWCQSLYRGFRGRQRAERRKAKRVSMLKANETFGIQRMVSGFLGAKPQSSLEDDEDTSESDDDNVSLTGTQARNASPVRPLRKISSTAVEEKKPTAMSQLAIPNGSSPNPPSTMVGYALTSLRKNLFAATNVVTPSGPGTPQTESNSWKKDEERNSGSPMLDGAKKSKGSSEKFRTGSGGVESHSPTHGHAHKHHKVKIQIEDEIWENQRYNPMAMRNTEIFRGWSDVALLPGERGGFSDRLGVISWTSLQSVPVPAGWKVTKDWTLDLHSTKCNSEGWQYAQTFAALDSNLASGRVNSSASARWLVRRRRWFRVREPDSETRHSGGVGGDRVTESGEDSICDDSLIYYGWLGMRGITTGRWTNSFTFIPHQKYKDHLGIAFCYFKKSAKVFNEDMSFRYELTLTKNKHLRVKFLDNECVVGDDEATREQPGLFTLHLSGEAEPRLLNAHSAEARVKWIAALKLAIQNSPGPCYEAIANRRSMRKGAAWEWYRASGAVKDLVGGSVRGMKHGFEKIKRGHLPGDMQRGESDPDLTQIDSLREEYRRSDAHWSSSHAPQAAPRKFSTDSVASAEPPHNFPPPFASALRRFSPTHHATPDRGFFKKSEQSPKTGSAVLPPVADASANPQQQPLTLPIASSTASLKLADQLEREATSGADEEQIAVMTISANSFNNKKNPLNLLKKLKRGPRRTDESLILSRSVSSQGGASVGEAPNSQNDDGLLEQALLANAAPPAVASTAPGGETNLNATFEMPPPYENIMFDGYFDMSVDEFDTFFMREEEFHRDLLAFEKMFDVEMDPWTNGINVGSEHRRRYKMPRVGVVPPGPSFHLLTRTQSCPGKGYVIDQTCSTPEMPWGQHFSTDFRNVFAAEGPNRCRVIISQKMTFFKTLMTQGFIKSGTKREVSNYYKTTWHQFLKKWLAEKRPHLIKGQLPSSGEPKLLERRNADASVEAGTEMSEGLTPDSHLRTSVDGGMISWRHVWILVAVLTLLLLALILHAIYLQKRMEHMETLLIQIAALSKYQSQISVE